MKRTILTFATLALTFVTNACGIASSTESDTKVSVMVERVIVKCAPPYANSDCQVLGDNDLTRGLDIRILDKICQDIVDINGNVVGYKSYDQTTSYVQEPIYLRENHGYISYDIDDNDPWNVQVTKTTIVGDGRIANDVISRLPCSTSPRR